MQNKNQSERIAFRPFALILAMSVALLSMPIAVRANMVTIDSATKYQTIDGFGWHGAMNLYWMSGPYYNDTWLALVVDTLGLSIERNCYVPGTQWTTQEKPFLQALHAKAVASGEPLVCFESILTPPATLKSNNSLIGGTLLPANYAAYGTFLISVAKGFADAGVPLYGLSPQNEPDMDVSYNSCVYTPQTYRDMFKVVAPMMKASYPHVKTIGAEHCCEDFATGWYADMLADTAMRRTWDIQAFHDYTSPTQSWYAGAANELHTIMNGKNMHTWQTESGFQGDDMETQMELAWQIHDNLAVAGVNAYVYYQGSGVDAQNDYAALLPDGTIRKRFYVFKQFYRFIRPGAVRIKSQTANPPDPNLLVTAYKRKTAAGGDNWAVVLINKDSTAVKGIRLAGNGLPAQFDVYQTSAALNCAKLSPIANTDSLTLPTQSITTLVYGDFHGGTDISTGIDNHNAFNGGTSRDVSMPLHVERSGAGLDVAYTVSAPSAVRIDILSIDGRLVATLANNARAPEGKYRVSWQPSRTMLSGVYVVKATIGSRTSSTFADMAR